MNRALHDDVDDDAFAQRIVANVMRMAQLAKEIQGQAQKLHPGLDDTGLAWMLEDVALEAPMLSPAWYALTD